MFMQRILTVGTNKQLIDTPLLTCDYAPTSSVNR